MSAAEEREPSHRPAQDADPRPLHYALSVQFHAPIKLLRPKGLEFASKISSAIDAKSLDLQESRWTFSQPVGTDPKSVFVVTVQESQIQVEAGFPTDRLELFEHRFDFILGEFKKFFKPDLILACQAMVRALLPVDGDAREFITSHVTSFDSSRLSLLGRPVHLFGLRLFMPPFQRPKKQALRPTKKKKVTKPSQNEVEVVDWMIDMKVESLMEDTSKLFLEASATWPTPLNWTSSVEFSQKLTTVSDYLRSNLIPFLVMNQDGSEP